MKHRMMQETAQKKVSPAGRIVFSYYHRIVLCIPLLQIERGRSSGRPLVSCLHDAGILQCCLGAMVRTYDRLFTVLFLRGHASRNSRIELVRGKHKIQGHLTHSSERLHHIYFLMNKLARGPWPIT